MAHNLCSLVWDENQESLDGNKEFWNSGRRGRLVTWCNWHRYWWRMMDTKFVGDEFEVFKIYQHNEKSYRYNDSAIGYYRKVTDITFSLIILSWPISPAMADNDRLFLSITLLPSIPVNFHFISFAWSSSQAYECLFLTKLYIFQPSKSRWWVLKD